MNVHLLIHLRAKRACTLLLAALLGSAVAAEAAPSRVRSVSARNLVRGYAAEPLAANELRPTERAFLLKAVDASRRQMRLAEIGVSQAVNSGVRSHAQQLAGDYRVLNAALEALIRRRGGMADAPVGGNGETYRELVTQSGSDFDRQFVRTVAGITDEVLNLFEQVVSESKDADVRELAAAQLPVLRGHRSEVTQLQKTFD